MHSTNFSLIVAATALAIGCGERDVSCADKPSNQSDAEENSIHEDNLKNTVVYRLATEEFHNNLPGMKDIAGPSYGFRSETIPGLLYSIDMHMNFVSTLSDRELLRALQEFFLLKFFSGPEVKLLSSSFQYPKGRFTHYYAEKNHLGQFTLILRKADSSSNWRTEISIQVHTQVQPKIQDLNLEAIDVRNMIEDWKLRNEAMKLRLEEAEEAAKSGPWE